MSRAFYGAYLAVVAVTMLVAQLDIKPLLYVFKGAPLLMLVVAVWRRPPGLGADGFTRWLWLGLVFGFVADLVIEFSFVGGLLAFLVGHLCYLAAMGLPRGPLLPHVRAALPAAFVFAVMCHLLVFEGLAPPEMQLPVAVYMFVITTMFGRACGRAWVEPGHRPAQLMAAGAALFVMSDSCIAVERWIFDLPVDHVIILGTYYLGQLAISHARA